MAPDLFLFFRGKDNEEKLHAIAVVATDEQVWMAVKGAELVCSLIQGSLQSDLARAGMNSVIFM